MATLLNEARSFEAAMRLVRATSVPNLQVERKRRVLIVASGSLVEAGVEMLLRREIDLIVSGCSFTSEPVFVQTVTHFRPDVIIMNESGEVTPEQVLELLGGKLAALDVIVVRSRDNAVEVYEYRQAAVSEVRDLLSLIRRGTIAPD
jgi:chemotaxis response regulator CheB